MYGRQCRIKGTMSTVVGGRRVQIQQGQSKPSEQRFEGSEEISHGVTWKKDVLRQRDEERQRP